MPFQLAGAGSHNSILISESLDGFIVAWTRQYTERFAAAATLCARVMVVLGIVSFDKFSQVVAAAAVWDSGKISRAVMMR